MVGFYPGKEGAIKKSIGVGEATVSRARIAARRTGGYIQGVSEDTILESSPTGKRLQNLRKDDYFITDLFSTNGTLVNGQAVPPGKYVRIEPGDRIKIGKTVLTLK